MRSRPIVIYAIVASLLALAGLFAIWFFSRPEKPLSAELTGPKLALEAFAPALRARPLFFTRADLPALGERWKEWGQALAGAAPEALAAEFEGTLQSPQAWRVLDRKWRFGAVLLTGEPAAFRPLLDHLHRSADWTLARVDPAGYVFERSPARAWTAAEIPATLEVFKNHAPVEQRTARLQLAHHLMFLEEMAAAKELLDETLALQPKSREAWTELAQWHGMAGDWPAALKAAVQALEYSRNYRPARTVQAEALAALGRFEEALPLTRDLYDAVPSDPQILLLHAKVTHGAHAYHEEIVVLQRLIGLLQGRSQSVAFWQLYLGQAYAATGNAILAEDQFKAALRDPGLAPRDREFALRALDQLEMKSDTLSTAPAPSASPSSLLDAPAYRP